MPQKILVISREFYPLTHGGLAKLIYEYLSRSKKFEYRVLTKKHHKRKNIDNIRFIQIDIPKKIERYRQIYGFYFVINSFIKALFISNISVIVGIGFVGPIVGSLLGIIKGKPRLNIIYDVDHLKKESELFNDTERLIRFNIQKLIFITSNKIMCGSDFSKKDMIKMFNISRDKIVTNPPGLDEKNLNNKTLKKRKNDNKTIFIFVGSISPKEGLEFIIEALNLLKKKRYPFLFYAVGKIVNESYYKKLSNLVDSFSLNDNVKFTDRVESVWPYYLSSDIFVAMTYHQKGFSMPVIEASSVGLPVVVPRYLEKVGVAINGKTGIVVKDKDSLSLFNALEELTRNPELRRRLGEYGKKFAEKFNWNKSAYSFEESLSQLYDIR